MDDLKIRDCKDSDITTCAIIERATYERAWTHEYFHRTLHSPGVIGRVAIVDSEIAGYCIYEKLCRAISIMNITVPLLHRCNGVGGAMVSDIASKLSHVGYTNLGILLGAGHEDAREFFKHRGFTTANGLHFVYRVGQHAPPRTVPVHPFVPANRLAFYKHW